MAEATAPTVPVRTVHCSVYDPTGFYLFKPKKNARAEVTTIGCSLGQCPLRDKGYCMCIAILGGHACPYGKKHKATGYTRRARGYRKWIEDHTAAYKDVPRLSAAPHRMAFVGDYIFLPYAYMSMCEAVPFLVHSSAFVQGTSLLPRKVWTIETVRVLVDFRPQALLGGEIEGYQDKVVPSFVEHLREEDPWMFKQLLEICPKYDKLSDYVGRHAYVRTLKPNIEWDAGKNSKYPVHWKWDGEALTTTSRWAYKDTWGGSIEAETVLVKIVPGKSATVQVQDNGWVVPTTEFRD